MQDLISWASNIDAPHVVQILSDGRRNGGAGGTYGRFVTVLDYDLFFYRSRRPINDISQVIGAPIARGKRIEPIGYLPQARGQMITLIEWP
ncbi:hypothetical protein GCM10010464_64770 [Pseudonocardia yunnanensis]